MKKTGLFFTCCLLPSLCLKAQQGWLPPLTFPVNTALCDEAPWQLVFADDFNGNHIDTTKWITFGSWPGMPGGDHQHWNGARSWHDNNYIVRDENVVVSEGTCKLLIRRETGNWQCSDCPNPIAFRRHISAASIATYRTLPDGTDNSYNNGRFEARIRFPVFKGAWCAFWTWHGLGVNEIDIAEAWGGGLTGSDQRRNTYNTHAWGPNPNTVPPEPNPYGLPYDAAWSNKFPGQGWWQTFFGGRRHRQDAWHTYTCEWDDNLLSFYIDSIPVSRFWKYIKDQGHTYNGHNYKITVGSGCKPKAGSNYYVNYGFPYNTRSASQLILLARVDRQAGLTADDIRAGKDSVLQPLTLGQMEIDYVKIWQRHPEQDNHQRISKAESAPVKDYNLHNLTDQQTENCNINIIHTLDNRNRQQFRLFEGSDLYTRDSTYALEWEITVNSGNGLPTQHYKRYGCFTATPFFHSPGNIYRMLWRLNIRRGNTLIATHSGAYNSPDHDTGVNYFEAVINDTEAYEKVVARSVRQHTVSETEAKDTAFLNQMIEQLSVEALAPYVRHLPPGAPSALR